MYPIESRRVLESIAHVKAIPAKVQSPKSTGNSRSYAQIKLENLAPGSLLNEHLVVK